MLTTALVNDTNVIRVTWEGALTPEEIVDLRHQIGFIARLYGEARLLVEVGDSGWVEPAEVWDGLAAVTAPASLDRVALVADESWIERAAASGGAVRVSEVAVFPTGRSDDAVAWACA